MNTGNKFVTSLTVMPILRLTVCMLSFSLGYVTSVRLSVVKLLKGDENKGSFVHRRRNRVGRVGQVLHGF